MSAKPGARSSDPATLLTVRGSSVAAVHSTLSASAFLLALLIGLALHYRKIVKNEHYGYPDEWFPSVSATIGDWYPERNVFQLLIALTSGPRLALVGLSYLLQRRGNVGSAPVWLAAAGVVRTLSCGGWVFVTSSDDHDVHDVMMIAYIVLNIPWMAGTIALSPSSAGTQRRKTIAWLFFGALVPLIYLFIQHKVHRVAGAYTRYAFVEWSLIAFDVAFDACAVSDLGELEVRVVAASSEEKAGGVAAPRPGRVRGPLEQKLAGWLASSAEARSFLSDSYLAFIFWTNLTAIAPMIFFFSVWSMGLSGEELLLFCVLSPFLLVAAPIRRFAAKYEQWGKAAGLLGIAAAAVDDIGGQRLRWVAAALGVSVAAYVSGWATKEPAALQQSTLSFLMGLVATIVVKFANHSINPLWAFTADPALGLSSGGWANVLGFGLGVAAAIDAIHRPLAATFAPRPTLRQPGSATIASVALGAELFLLHWLFTDSGTIIAWGWTGFPITGPRAMPHGLLTIVAVVVGVASSTSVTSAISELAMFATASLAALALYAFDDWASFAGGLALATWATRAFGVLLRSASHHPAQKSGVVFGGAFAVYAVLELASVWTVAYAFVPGGKAMRERTDLVLGVTMVLLGAGVWNATIGASAELQRTKVEAASTTVGEKRKLKQLTTSTRQVFWSRVTFVNIVLLAGIVAILRESGAAAPTPFNVNGRVVTAGIWTMHFALDGRMHESQRRIAAFLQDAEVDIIGLLESDLQRITMGNRDITQLAAATAGYHADIGPGPDKHTWGCALLSKFPILNSTHHLLPSPNGELAPAIHATLDVHGVAVDVIVAHNGQEEDPLDRELQSKELGRLMRESWPRPVIFLGYVVTKPQGDRPDPYYLLVEDGLVNDIDPSDQDRWCEYILYRGLKRVGYARVNRGSDPAITDTEIQLGKFVVPEPTTDGSSPAAPDVVNRRTGEMMVPEQHRFPSKFKNEGTRGHFYHVLTDQQGKPNPWYYQSEADEQTLAEQIVQSLPDCTTQ